MPVRRTRHCNSTLLTGKPLSPDISSYTHTWLRVKTIKTRDELELIHTATQNHNICNLRDCTLACCWLGVSTAKDCLRVAELPG